MAAPRLPVMADMPDLGVFVPYVPVIAAQTVVTTPPTFIINRAEYCRIGSKLILVSGDISIVAANTGSGSIFVDPPFPIDKHLFGASYEYIVSGFGGNCIAQTSNQKIACRKYDATTWIVSGQSIIFGLLCKAT